MKTVLSQNAVARLSYDKSDPSNTHFDEVLPGFAVRVYPTGSKRYLLKFYYNGRQFMRSIGDVHKMSFEEARTKASEILRQAKSGDLRMESVVEKTVTQFCEEYMEKHAKPRKRSWKLDEQRCLQYIIPNLGHLKLSQVNRRDVHHLLFKIGLKENKPIAANRLHEQISKMFDLASSWGYVPTNFQNPAKGFDPFPEKSCERFLTDEEIKRLNAVLDKEFPLVRNYFRFLLLTGIRKRKALNLKWSDIDWSASVITVQEDKHGGKGRYPLTPVVRDHLKQIERQPDNPYVFCSPRIPGAPLQEVKSMWERIKVKAELDNVRIHDLRHTVGAAMAQNGESLQVIALCLGHKSIESTKVYAHLVDEQAKSAFTRFQQKLSRLEVSDED